MSSARLSPSVWLSGVPRPLLLGAIAGFLSDQLGYRVPALLPRAGDFPG